MDVHVGDDDAEHAAPRPDRMALVEHCHPPPRAISRLSELGLRIAVQPAANQVPPRVTPEGVPAEQEDVDEHDPGPETDLHMAVRCPEREVDVVPEESGDDQHKVEQEPVEV